MHFLKHETEKKGLEYRVGFVQTKNPIFQEKHCIPLIISYICSVAKGRIWGV